VAAQKIELERAEGGAAFRSTTARAASTRAAASGASPTVATPSAIAISCASVSDWPSRRTIEKAEGRRLKAEVKR
jgi:hypothetical protein